jgi:hypothetical protein
MTLAPQESKPIYKGVTASGVIGAKRSPVGSVATVGLEQ